MSFIKSCRLAKPVSTFLRQLETTSAYSKVFKVQSRDEFLENVVSSKQPVVVDFHAKYYIRGIHDIIITIFFYIIWLKWQECHLNFRAIVSRCVTVV